MNKKSLIILLIVMSITFFAGCNDAKQTGGQESTKSEEAGLTAEELSNPEQLFSKEEAEEMLGEPVKEPENNATKNAMGQILYLYSAESEESHAFIQLSLVKNQLMSDTLREQDYNVKKMYDETKNMLGDVQEVEGIGEEAFWGTNGLHILEGDYYLNISAGLGNDPEKLEQAKKIAGIVVERLN